MASQEPLDEIQWSNPAMANQFGIHSNSVLFYFAESPFYEPTSNNAVLYSQALNNAAMFHLVHTREAFEGRLKTMAGLEFMVAEAPKDPMNGTGVWVIRKQIRKKHPGEEDEVQVLDSYFVVNQHIYKAPRLADIFTTRIATASNALRKSLPAAANALKWTPALGHYYQRPDANRQEKDVQQAPSVNGIPPPSALFAEESFRSHIRYGGEYMDENPINGQPGNFTLSSTGRVVDKNTVQPPPLLAPIAASGVSAIGTNKKDTGKEKESGGKTPKTPSGAPRPKRKKSKGPNSAQ